MKHILDLLSHLSGISCEAENLTTPPDPSMGDLSYRCFELARELKKSPLRIAEDLAQKITPDSLIKSAVASGPYLNFTLYREGVLASVLETDVEKQNIGKGEVVVIDYSHPNIAKPFHFGHLRSTNIGADLARMYEYLGYRVFRKNYLGDWGTQFGYVIYSWLKYGKKEILEERAVDYLVELYIQGMKDSEKDQKVTKKARNYFSLLEAGDPEILQLWESFRSLSIKNFKETYHRLGVHFDSYDGEASISPQIPGLVQRFKDAGLVKESDGALIVDVGDLIGKPIPPLMLLKSDGSSTYAARDCAEALDRWEKHGFHLNLYVVARQEDHFSQVFAALKKLSQAEGWETDWTDRCITVPFGYVRGMSTRRGKVIWLSDVLDEAKFRARGMRIEKQKTTSLEEVSEETLETLSEQIGQAALLYFDVSSLRKTDVSFDWNSALRFEGSTGPYLQYAHARISGVFRKAESFPPNDGKDEEPIEDSEWGVVLKLRKFNSEIEWAVQCKEPFYLARYLYDLSSQFSTFYQSCKVLNLDHLGTSYRRLQLCQSVQKTLATGLRLLGIEPLDVM